MTIIINLLTMIASLLTVIPAYNQNAIPTGPPEFPIITDWPLIIQPVAFHILYKSDGTGMISNDTLISQVSQLNDAFSGSDARHKKYRHPTNAGIKFIIGSVDYTENNDLFDSCALWNYQSQIKKALFRESCYNVYTCNVATSLGLSIIPYQISKIYGFPNEPIPLPENHWYLGSLIDHRLLVGSTVFNGKWSQGLILIHETGHHYGLMHLYQGGCIGDETYSDNIADTPRQVGNPSKSCQKLKGLRSCSTNREDDNSNYMSINYDSCRSHFTPGQVSYFRHIISIYKPILATRVKTQD